ncbi:MAG: Smr/MutS family protein [Chloroflexi bacterium]|nr:Smr/MutS family protein [Chloroflexota bacterium]
MTPKSLQTLEYDKIIARLAALCETAPGRTLAEALLPSPDYREVLHRQRLTAEARRLLEMKPGLSLAAARDVRSLVHQAALGHVLEPTDLLNVHATLSLARSIRETVSRLRVQVPLLAETAERIAEFRELTAEIARCVNQRAEVVDAASPVLAQLRRDSHHAHDRLSRRLQQLVSSPAARAALQEPIVTLRDGRYVIPVKAELRSQLPGIVHDVSSSGATVFLEPLETVEMGNAWREMLAEEEREVQRILRDLSALAGARADDITAAVDAMAEIDLSLGKARLGQALGAELPHEGHDQPWLLEKPAGGLLLVDARHPLLKGDVVPITVWVGRDSGPTSKLPSPTSEAREPRTKNQEPRPAGDGEAPTSNLQPPTSGSFSVLLITGPNTGGKTVALKTVGLVPRMAQAGLPVPAGAGSRLPVFDAVYADIGDEQSIEQSLSTFSSHVGNIIGILASATAGSLVLLDELGAGTDPTEGAALAKGILAHLLRVGCLTVATTHHGELKAFAHVTAGVMNASVEFDPETLAPTYRLHIGLPGGSNALAIARRLGMPPDILDEARASIDPDRLAVETLIVDLHRQREQTETARAAQQAAAQAAEKARDRVTRELASLETNRDRLLERTRQEMEAELAQARARVRDALRELERAERLSVFERAAAVEAAQEQVAAVEESLKKLERRRKRPRRGPLPAIEPGDRLYLRDLPLPGEALSAPDTQGELEVKLGALRARISVRQIERVEKPGAEEVEKRKEEIGHRPRAPISHFPSPISPELDLRGLAVDEALPLIDQRLDEAFRAGVPQVRLVHGKGTGTLRAAVRQMLSKHPLVRSHAPAEPRKGGDGVTVVELAT